jgi:hypothetical protein
VDTPWLRAIPTLFVPDGVDVVLTWSSDPLPRHLPHRLERDRRIEDLVNLAVWVSPECIIRFIVVLFPSLVEGPQYVLGDFDWESAVYRVCPANDVLEHDVLREFDGAIIGFRVEKVEDFVTLAPVHVESHVVSVGTCEEFQV